MRIACLQHAPFEGPAALGGWAATQGHPLSLARLFANEPAPPLDSFDTLVILGGPMSANDEDRFDWLRPEKQFIRNSIERGKRVLGICLGAQLIANTMGARVFPNSQREIGWFPVQRTAESAGHSAFAALPRTFTPLHWHGETFELPSGATREARSEGCAHQAFSIGNHVLGLQFHLESTPESAEALARNCPGDLTPGRFVQAPHTLLSAHARFHESNRLMGLVLEGFAAAPGRERASGGDQEGSLPTSR